jgi:6-pyruvoyltetrahydropterin/6-carboxytetrahydropterin synthase
MTLSRFGHLTSLMSQSDMIGIGTNKGKGTKMYRLWKHFKFEASHQLPHHDGKCKRLHGHSWVGKVIVEGDLLFKEGPKAGMLMDYSDIAKAINPLVEQYLDHWHLNDSLKMESPTSELVAKWVYDELLKSPIGPFLAMVEINETCTSSCQYWCAKPVEGKVS